MDTFYYVIVNGLCMVIVLLLLMQLRHKYHLRSMRRMLFEALLWMTMLLSLAGMVGGISDGKLFPGSRAALEIGKMMYYEAVTLTAALWMFYVYIRLHENQTIKRTQMFFLSIPLLLMTAVILTNPVTKVLFYIDAANNYSRNAGVYLHWAATWFYLLVPTVWTAVAITREKRRYRQQQYIPLVYFIIAPVLAACIQMVVSGASTMQTGVTVSVVLIYLTEQEKQLLTDLLTGINNRRGLEHYYNGYLMKHPGTQLDVLLVDVLGMKKINAELGHVEGDAMLLKVAEALKCACADAGSGVVLCRYEGDAFAVVSVGRSEEARTALNHTVQRCIALQNADPKPAELRVSLSQTSGLCEDMDDVEHLLRLANEQMYRERRTPQR